MQKRFPVFINAMYNSYYETRIKKRAYIIRYLLRDGGRNDKFRAIYPARISFCSSRPSNYSVIYNSGNSLSPCPFKYGGINYRYA
ncbi:MAG: hypothetical protein DDT33_00920 [Firmicutes bacterium]|nr:hypothetical protein [Bacillota bacterium]